MPLLLLLLFLFDSARGESPPLSGDKLVREEFLEKVWLLLEEMVDTMIKKEVVKVITDRDAKIMKMKEKMGVLEAVLEKSMADPEKNMTDLEKNCAHLEKKNMTLSLNCSEVEVKLDLNQTLVTVEKGLIITSFAKHTHLHDIHSSFSLSECFMCKVKFIHPH